jgi:hypothetical protein
MRRSSAAVRSRGPGSVVSPPSSCRSDALFDFLALGFGAKSQTSGVAGSSRRGYGEDGIYLIAGRTAGTAPITRPALGAGAGWSGFDADGKRIRKKVSGTTRTEVKDKLNALHAELDAGLRTAQGYTVEKAVADWLGGPVGAKGAADLVRQHDELPGRAGGGDRPAGRACQLADYRGGLPAGAAAGDHDGG